MLLKRNKLLKLHQFCLLITRKSIGHTYRFNNHSFCYQNFFRTPCTSFSPKSKLHFQWIWTPMTFKIPKIYVLMLAEFKIFNPPSRLLCRVLQKDGKKVITFPPKKGQIGILSTSTSRLHASIYSCHFRPTLAD